MKYDWTTNRSDRTITCRRCEHTFPIGRSCKCPPGSGRSVEQLNAEARAELGEEVDTKAAAQLRDQLLALDHLLIKHAGGGDHMGELTANEFRFIDCRRRILLAAAEAHTTVAQGEYIRRLESALARIRDHRDRSNELPEPPMVTDD